MRNDRELQKAVLAVMLGKKDEQVDEAMHPNQKQLDKNKNGKLDKQDFEMLRAGKEKKEVMEDEQIDELKKSTLASYVKKSADDLSYSSFKSGATHKGDEADADFSDDKDEEKARKRQAGITRAATKLAKEETEIEEEVDETVIYHKAFDVEIKESYTFGEYLTAAKNLVGEEQAIELANNAFRSQDTSIFAEEVSRMDIENRVKQHSAAGHKVSMPKYSTRDGKLHAEYIVTDKESGVRRKYIHHGSMRKVENMGTAGKKDQE